MLSCEVLQSLQNDLSTLSKTSRGQFKKQYKLAPGAEIAMSFNEVAGSSDHEIAVNSSSGLVEARLDGHRKIPPLMVGLASEKVTEYLLKHQIEPCERMEHGGADELLALYKCMHEFKTSPVIPFYSDVKTSNREYRILSIRKDNRHWRIEITTNHIYGESVKTIAEVEFEGLIAEQCYGLIGRMLEEWLRPESVKAVKVALASIDRS